ncbi:MAG: hypothetical protein AAGA75_23880, partial [Cyanobacteria bacterium P01_E01_bin.6]
MIQSPASSGSNASSGSEFIHGLATFTEEPGFGARNARPKSSFLGIAHFLALLISWHCSFLGIAHFLALLISWHCSFLGIAHFLALL